MNVRFLYVDGGVHPILGEVLHTVVTPVGDDGHRYLRYFCNPLSMVIHTIEDCERALELIKKVETGEEAQITLEGNDTEILVNSKSIQVSILLADEYTNKPEGVFKTTELKHAILGYRHFLQMPQVLGSAHEVTL